MNWELIGWIGAGILISEIIFILLIKNVQSESWIHTKVIALMLGGVFTLIQSTIVFELGSETLYTGNSNYMNLLWEVLIIGGIVLFFWLNKKLADWIDMQ